MNGSASWSQATAAQVRAAIRRGEITGPTAGMAAGYAQANVVILPQRWASDFAEFCRRNPRPCPLIAQTAPGQATFSDVAPDGDLRTDVPRYRVFRHGRPEADKPSDIVALWRDDLVGFLLGCSFTFETALDQAGLTPRHVQLGRNVSMYRTNIACAPAGAFAGPLVVSMRPYRPHDVPRVSEISARFATMHGAPLHVGAPEALGIADLSRPDFGAAVPIEPGEVPVFWACGVTPQLALESAAPDLAITHSPGCMFVMDRTDDSFAEAE